MNTIVEDTQGLYWIGTRGEACTFDGIRFADVHTMVGPLINVRSIVCDSEGTLWFGGDNGLWSLAWVTSRGLPI